MKKNIFLASCIFFGLFSFFLHSKSSVCERPIVVVILSYNNAHWYKRNLNSIFNQKYSNFQVIYLDDCSTDWTGDLVERYVYQNGWQDKCKIIKNTERKFRMENFYDVVHKFCGDGKIIVEVDGDDWLINENVFSAINRAYSDSEVWMTYGSYTMWPHQGFCYGESFPDDVVKNNSYRSYKWVASHLKTFYAWLFKKIKKEDLQYQGKFLERAVDLGYMFPMLEMAGGRFKFIEDVLYVYNRSNPINVDKVDRDKVILFNKIIREKPCYEKL